MNARCGSRLVLFAMMLVAGVVAGRGQNPDPGAAEKYGWGFRNFNDTVFSWDIYSHSFFGVPLDSNDAWLTSSFDKLFYKLAFRKTLPNPKDDGVGIGNCYGVSLMSLMINRFGGFYGYCAPTSGYHGDTTWNGGNGPNDPQLHRLINIMHGHQLSLASIESYLDQASGGKSENSNFAVNIARQTIGKEGPCIVSITEYENPFKGGHALIAYGVTQDGSGHAKIWVVDPNRLWAVPSSRDRGWYQEDSNFIFCDLASGDWHFRMSDSTLWPSDPKGHLIIMPISLIGPPGRVPSSLGLSVSDLVSRVFLTDWNSRKSNAILSK